MPANERVVHPGETDENLRTPLGTSTSQFGYVPRNLAAAKGSLFIMLPGTLSEPKDYKLILQAAAESGYHAIGLDYDNRTTIKSICQNSNDPDCSFNALNEYLTGNNTSGDVSIGRAESFENRISKMLVYLNENHPGDNWGQFITTQGMINWRMVSLAGHSQGGTHALYISKVRPLLRASFFSSPYGFESGGSFPEWITDEGLTPSNKLFAFNHKSDRLMNWDEVNRTLNAAGLSGAKRLIDVHNDLEGFQRFYTQVSKGFGLQGGAHGATCVDNDTPKDRNRNPKFKDVWQYMCFP